MVFRKITQTIAIVEMVLTSAACLSGPRKRDAGRDSIPGADPDTGNRVQDGGGLDAPGARVGQAYDPPGNGRSR